VRTYRFAAMMAMLVALAAPAGASAAKIAVEASGGGMTVNGSDRADQIQAGYDPERPDLIVVSDPRPPYGPFVVGGTCEMGIDPAGVAPEVRCTLAEASGKGARVVVSSHGGGDKVWIGTLDKSGRVDPALAFPYKGRGIGGPGDDRMFVAGELSHVGGDAGDDLLMGGTGVNLLTGAGGNDRLIDRWGGNDILHGGKAGDVLDAGPGRDLLTGWKGRDVLLGGSGGDRLYSRDGWRDKRIDCGPGEPDEARVEVDDPRASRCEAIRRIGRDLAVGEEIDFP
jgi:RTX calcium-binding nonapeptide repeat (4 copies)